MSRAEVLTVAVAPSGYQAVLDLDQTVLDAMPAAVYLCAADGVITRFNRRAAELWGRMPRPGDTDQRFCGAFRLYRLDGQVLPHAATPMATALATGEPQRDQEVTIERPDGSRVVALVNIAPLLGRSGEVEGAINCFQDITARKQAETLLRESDHRSRAVLDALPAAIYTTDPEGRITFFNRAAAEWSGTSPRLGHDKWCVTFRLHRPDGTPLPHDQCPMAQALKEQRPIRGAEALAERPDGTRVPFIPYPTPLFDSAGKMTGAVNMLVDISERRRAEDAAQRLAAIVESSDDAIMSKNLDGIVTSWNKGAERLFGYAANEIIGKPITTLMPFDGQSEERRIIERIRRGERIEHYETVRRRKDGTLIDISLTVSPLRSAGGRIVGASKIARDITQRKHTLEALARHIDEQSALYHLTDRLHRAEKLDDVYDAALDAIRGALRCGRASILLYDETNVMRFVAWRGLSDGYRRAVEGHTPWTPDVVDPSPISIGNIDEADIGDNLRATVKAERIGALAFIPLMANGRLVGKFMTYYDAPHTFSNAEIDLSVTIARQVGFSVERMRAREARRVAEAALRAREAELEIVINRTPFMLTRCTRDLRYRVVSDAVAQMLQKRPEDIVGRSVVEVVGEEVFRVIRPHIERVLAGERVEYEEELPYRGIGPRYIHGVYTPEKDANGVVTGWIASLLDVTERKKAERQRVLMVAELSHRVKNTLATVISIARQSFSKNRNPEESQRSFDARIHALAHTHGRLAEANWSGVSLETLLHDELAPYRREDGGNMRLSGPPTMLSPRCALTIGMALHELATNAAKYGALSGKDGVVHVVWEVDPEQRRLRVRWSESGGPAVAPPQRSGFGRLLLERAIASDLDGHVRMDFASGGVTCAIDIPLDENFARAD